MTPRMKQEAVRKTELLAMTLKNRQVMKVQRKVVEKNMTLQPPKYKILKNRKTNIGARNSRRTPNHP